MSIEKARRFTINHLDGEQVTSETIREALDIAVKVYPLKEAEQERLLADLELHFRIIAEDFQIISEQYTPWLRDRSASIDWLFWDRYKEYLQFEKKIPDGSLKQMNILTDFVLDRMGNPQSQQFFDTRGMVVGHVQSGKTANYTGLICKATDAGYKFIVVLAGIHNSLRSQTQMRIDEGFIGKISDNIARANKTSPKIGVGNFNSKVFAQTLTSHSENGDFNQRIANGSGIHIVGSNDPIIAVIKKNAAVLKSFISWLHGQADSQTDGRKSFRELPLLLIDDEADNASINTSKDDISKINKSIRVLMRLFDKKAYVGYTATPFANIFIPYEPEATVNGVLSVNDIDLEVDKDLFPKDFIVNLLAPSNYIGPKQVFGLGGADSMFNDINAEDDSSVMPVLRTIEDYKDYIPDRHKSNDEKPGSLPVSLKTAIVCFVLSTAARLARGQDKFHSSMLVHVSSLISWHNAIGLLVYDELNSLRYLIKSGSPNTLRSLKNIWETDYINTTQWFIDSNSFDDHNVVALTWDDIQPHLINVVSKTEVRIVHGLVDNSGSTLVGPLNYHDHENGLFVIAIGGNKLSRGLTLEGLCVSYFLRASKMYDTLMQMGRWFGYRPGYADLCRLFTSQELNTWYRHIANASDEMRRQFDVMATENSTPKEYGLKVRTLPGVLQVSALNKIRAATTMELSYSDSLVETYTFSKSAIDYDYNFKLLEKLLKDLGKGEMLKPHVRWEKVSANWVINFVTNYKYATTQRNMQPGKLAEYIEQQTDNLVNWTVVLVGTLPSSVRQKYIINAAEPYEIYAIERSGDSASDSADEFRVIKAHIVSPEHEVLDFTPEQVEEARHKTLQFRIQKWQNAKKLAENRGKDFDKPEPTLIPDRASGPAIRRIRNERNGLLLIYPIDPTKVKTADGLSAFSNLHPMIGYAISFPHVKDDIKVTYLVNEQFLSRYESPEDLDETEDSL